jgi:hypothetical protein
MISNNAVTFKYFKCDGLVVADLVREALEEFFVW